MINSKRKLKKEDLIFVKRIRKAWKAYDRGEFTSSTAEEFLEELKKIKTKDLKASKIYLTKRLIW